MGERREARRPADARCWGSPPGRARSGARFLPGWLLAAARGSFAWPALAAAARSGPARWLATVGAVLLVLAAAAVGALARQQQVSNNPVAGLARERAAATAVGTVTLGPGAPCRGGTASASCCGSGSPR